MRLAAPTARGRWALFLASAGVAWSAVLVVAAYVAPVYSSDPALPAAERTLVAVNGGTAVLTVALPLAVAVGVWLALHRACKTGAERPRLLAGVLLALLAGFCLVTGFTVGMVVAPAVLALAAARELVP